MRSDTLLIVALALCLFSIMIFKKNYDNDALAYCE
jgi:hypothetical protein